jgi:hypothetical protein
MIFAAERNFHRGFGSSLLKKGSENFIIWEAVVGRFDASLRSSHVHPSLHGVDFWGLHVKASVMALIGISIFAILCSDGGLTRVRVVSTS